MTAGYVKKSEAHPHVFVESVVDIIFDAEGLAAVKMKWVFDDITSSQYLMDLDTNGDGKLPAAEWNAQRADIAGFLAEENFFIHVMADGERIAVKTASEFLATYEDGLLIYEILVPVRVRRNGGNSNVQIALYDPSYYSDFYTPFDEFHLKGQTQGVLLDVDDAPELAFYSGQVIPIAARLTL